MRTVELNEKQRDKVLKALEDITGGDFDIDIEIDEDLTVNATGHLEIDGYRESETGAYIETYRNANIELSALLFDEETDGIEKCNLVREFENECEIYLNTIAS